jgi:hypothetical protein
MRHIVHLIKDTKTICKFTTAGLITGFFGALGYTSFFEPYKSEKCKDVHGILIIISTILGVTGGLALGISKAFLNEVIDACHHQHNGNVHENSRMRARK